jgi:hypothetical protein
VTAPDEPEATEEKPTTGTNAAKRMTFTKVALDKLLKTRPQRQYSIWDSKEPHLSVLVSRGPEHKKRGTVTFRCIYYLPTAPGKPRYIAIGRWPDGTYTYPYKDEKKGKVITIRCSDIDAVRVAASDIFNRAKTQGIDPRRPPASGGFADVVKVFMEEHASKKRSYREIERIFDRYVLPEWGTREITDIERNDVAVLLSKIKNGKVKYQGRELGSPTVASATLAWVTRLFNWHAARSNKFVNPVVKGMLDKDDKPKSRDRFLSDAELRVLWPLLTETYGAVLKCALLTAQRFHKVSSMRHADLKERETIPAHLVGDQWVKDQHVEHVWDAGRDDDPDNKGVSAVPLSDLARAVIASVPVIISDDPGGYVFSLNGREPIKGWSKLKRELDTAMAAALAKEGIEFKDWQHRDLRRTARTLMMRAGVSRDIAERCLAHEIPGVEAIYDRHGYLREKQQAFAQLAALIERIVKPPTGSKVVSIRRG